MSRRTRWVLLGLLVVAVGVYIATGPTFREFFDLGVYRGAVHHWLVQDRPLYDYLHEGTEYGFTYPPFAAVLMSPLALLPWPVAVALSIIANAALTGYVLHRFLLPIARRRGWPVPTTWVIGCCAAAIVEPVLDTFSFGQVNLLLMALVLGDLARLRQGRLAGVGIGLAMAVKLTPGVFLLYLLVTRRFSDAAVAIGTFAAATLAAVAVDPAASAEFWTHALWQTDRVGNLAYVSNQSLRGALARLDASTGWWLLLVGIVVAVWAVRVRRADVTAGVVLTGVLGALISPVSWVHHLVWLVPAILMLLDAGRWRIALACYALLCSHLVWLWWDEQRSSWHGVLGSNLYVLVGLALLVLVPVEAPARVRRERTVSPPG